MGKRQFMLEAACMCMVLMMGLAGCEAAPEDGQHATGDTQSSTSSSLDGGSAQGETSGGGNTGPTSGPDASDLSSADGGTATTDGLESESEPGWQALSLGDDGELAAISVLSASEAYAVGGHRALRYNGETWASYGDFPTVTLHGVWGSDGVVVVSGSNGYIARRHHGEMAWTVEETGTGVTFRAVAGRDQDDIWAVGDEGTIVHYTGPESGWQLVDTSPHLDLFSIWIEPGSENENGILLGGSGGVVMYGTDAGWVEQQVAVNDSTLHAVLGVGEARFAVGSDAAIAVKPDAESPWQGMLSNMSKPRHLYSLATAGSDKIYAFGESATVIRYMGTSWSVQSVQAQAYASANLVAAGYGAAEPTGTGRWFALSENGGGLIRDDDDWVDMHTEPTKGLKALIADSDGNRWAAGPKGLLMAHTELHGWTSIDTPTIEDLNALSIDDAGNLWIVGDAGTLMKMDADGVIEPIATPILSDLYAVAIFSDKVVVAGKGGTLWRGSLDGTGFLPWALGVSSDLYALMIGGDGALWMAGAYGQLWRSVDGESASVIGTPVSGNLNHMAELATGVVIAGDNGVVLQVDVAGDEAIPSVLHEEPGLFLYGISAYDDEIIAVGWNGKVIRLRDGEVISESTGATAILESVWQDESGETTVGRLPTVFSHSEAP